jgi:hypothetical protein
MSYLKNLLTKTKTDPAEAKKVSYNLAVIGLCVVGVGFVIGLIGFNISGTVGNFILILGIAIAAAGGIVASGVL